MASRRGMSSAACVVVSLSGQRDLRVVEVAAGGALSDIPGLADHLAHYVLQSDAFVEPRAHAALQRLRG